MKRHLFKSILSLFLCLSMILVPINVYAAGDTGNSVVETPNGNIIITESDTIRTAEMIRTDIVCMASYWNQGRYV